MKPIKIHAEDASAVRIKWNSSLLYCGPYPAPQKRFYKLETLFNAVEKGIRENDRFLHQGLKLLCTDQHFTSAAFDLIYEDADRYTFSLFLTTRTRKQISARFVVAKNHEECSASLEKECLTLTSLGNYCPERVMSPARFGVVFLPDRHKRKDIQREVFAYMYKCPAELTPLYVASSSQLGPRGVKPLRYSVKETEHLKGAIVSLVAACYDEKTFIGLNPEDLTAEGLAIRPPISAGNKLMLVQCPRLQKRIRSGQIIEKLLFGTLRAQKTVFPIAPALPEAFFEALTKSISREKAREWCAAFFARHETHGRKIHLDSDISLPGRDYLSVLKEISGV